MSKQPNYGIKSRQIGINKGTLQFFGSCRKVTLFTDEIITRGNEYYACRELGYNLYNYEKIKQNDKRLQELIEKALYFASEVAEGILYERATKGHLDEKSGKTVYSEQGLRVYLTANHRKYASKKPEPQKQEVELVTFTDEDYK